MLNLIIISLLFATSVVLAIISYEAVIVYPNKIDSNSDKVTVKNAPWEWKFFEVWNYFISFFIAGLIGYYFVVVRWKSILINGTVYTSDFILFFIFSAGILRWYPYMIKNFTEGLSKIVIKTIEKITR